MDQQQVFGAEIREAIERMQAAVPRWLDVPAAASYASVSEKTVRRLLSAGKLTAHRPVRGKILIDRRQLDAFIQSATARPVGGRGRPESAPAQSA